MASYNRTVLMGHLTRDPELKFLSGKRAVCEVGLAVNSRYKPRDSEEVVEEVDFFDLVFYGKIAEVVNEYMTKGSPILIEGRLKQNRWEKDNKKHSRVKVVVDQMQMLGRRSADEQQEDYEVPNEEQVAVGTGATAGDNF